MTIETTELRNTLGKFATGVCVVTTEGPNGPIGMTINSFSSLSLEPALLLWSIQKNSECFAPFNAAKGYAISVLTEEQMEISNKYAQRGSHLLDAEEFTQGKTGQFILKQAVATFECSVWARYEGGDHIILVGEVEAFSASNDHDPILFYSGGYRTLAEQV
ncbi:flavin reductase family protein [Sessilibacter corallicola]|uniref:Flavin reductase family protein n=1 Tax=Sessilibacter corallicola TaxID=2904075 RepID=A0ABQ0AAY0_9GAMM|nr:flavin reductase family protein [Sessilibacter corallicola]